MKTRYRLVRRGLRGDAYYCVDTKTGKRVSLRTSNEEDAQRIVHAKNEALRQPSLNLQIAKAYLAGTDSGVTTRTWADALKAITETKQGPTRHRWETAAKDHALAPLWRAVVIETQAETLFQVLKNGTVSTNVYLRRIHNFCVDMSWLPWPIIPKRQWPAVRYGEKRAITWEEHSRVVEREQNPERKAFYQLAWHLGASQTDIALLEAKDIDWELKVVSYERRKTGAIALLRFGPEAEAVLRSLRAEGPLFPYLRTVRSCALATERPSLSSVARA